MADKTTQVSTVTIDNPEQASTNFYWTYISKENQCFNLQTTIRGILTYDQVKAHIKSALEAAAHIQSLGGQAKQVGRNAYEAVLPLPEAISFGEAVEPAWNPQEAVTVSNPVAPIAPTADITGAGDTGTFITEKLLCTVTNDKKYFHVKGGTWLKYGVTVWDEVLVTVGVQVGRLEGGKEYDFAGYTATFVKKADGLPKKVIKLEKIA